MTGADYSKLIYLVIIGSIIAFTGYYSIRSLLDLARLELGNRCTGKVVKKRIDPDDGRLYYVTYAFQGEHGRLYEREIQVRKVDFENLSESQGVNVVYQANNPTNSYLADADLRRSHFFRLCGLLLVAAVLAYIAYSFIGSCVIRNACGSEN